jgi:hypothetical protein
MKYPGTGRHTDPPLLLVLREPPRRRVTTFVPRRPGEHAPELSPAQKRVLVALCRPFREGDAFARPASNKEIADAPLSVAAVKTHLRSLFLRFGVEDLPQNEKRARLVQKAFEEGALLPAALDAEL